LALLEPASALLHLLECRPYGIQDVLTLESALAALALLESTHAAWA
jgi:hypothetical protein